MLLLLLILFCIYNKAGYTDRYFYWLLVVVAFGFDFILHQLHEKKRGQHGGL